MESGLIGVIFTIILKQYRPEFAIYTSLIVGTVIVLIVMDKFADIINVLMSLAKKVSINNQFLSILLKITGIAFLTEFAVSICRDSGESAIASKIDLGGKTIIIGMSIPIISALLELIIKILP